MAEERSILLKVELDVAQLKKSGDEAAAKLDQLKVKQSLLRGESKQGTLEYAKLSNEIRKTSKELKDNATALEINERLTKKNTGSMNDMKEQMLSAKIALGQMSKEMRESEAGRKLVKDIDDLNEALKAQEAEFGQFGRNVGNYAGTLAEMKAELKSLKGEMLGLDAGSEAYQKASEKAGELGDKIKEVNENVKASSGGTGFEKMSNNLGLIKGDLENLDFAGVAEKMGQMAIISQQMTFKEALGGLKNMGSALLSLGKAILMNPLFLMVGAIIAIGAALKMWNDSVKAEAVAAQKAHTKSIEDTIAMMDKQAGRAQEISDLFIRRAELEGKSAKEIGKLKLEASDETNKAEKEQILNHRNAIALLRKESALAESEEDRAALKDKIKEHWDAEDQLVFNQTFYAVKRKNLEIETNQAILDETKAANDKRKEQAQKSHDDRLALEKQFRDLLLEGTDLSIANEEKAIEAKYKFLIDTAEGNIDELLRLEAEKNVELAALDIKAKEQETARVTEQYKREREDAKGNAKILAELKRNELLEKESIELDFQAKADDRLIAHGNAVEQLEKERAITARKVAQEIEIIDAEINLARKKGSQDEFSAWSNLQFAKVRHIESNAELELQNALLTADEKLKIEKQAQLDIQNIQNQTFENAKQKQEEEFEWTKQNKKDLALSAVNAAQQLSDTLFQISNNQIQQELNDEKAKYDAKSTMLQNQLDNGIISQAEFNAQKSALDSAFNAKEKALKEDQFKRNKASQLINATIAAAVGVVNALAAPPPLGLIMAGIATALGAAQIAVIASQPTPTFGLGGKAKEGVFGGKPHSGGGTKGFFDDGTQIEVEKDEAFFVLNKRSTGMISRLSGLNVKGGGVPFMERGGALTFATGGVFSGQASKSVDNQMQFQNMMLMAIASMPSPVVFVEDLNTATNNKVEVESRGNIY